MSGDAFKGDAKANHGLGHLGANADEHHGRAQEAGRAHDLHEPLCDLRINDSHPGNVEDQVASAAAFDGTTSDIVFQLPACKLPAARQLPVQAQPPAAPCST